MYLTRQQKRKTVLCTVSLLTVTFCAQHFNREKGKGTLTGSEAWSEGSELQPVYLVALGLCGLFLISPVRFFAQIPSSFSTQYFFVSLPFQHAVVTPVCPKMSPLIFFFPFAHFFPSLGTPTPCCWFPTIFLPQHSIYFSRKWQWYDTNSLLLVCASSLRILLNTLVKKPKEA